MLENTQGKTDSQGLAEEEGKTLEQNTEQTQDQNPETITSTQQYPNQNTHRQTPKRHREESPQTQ
jgi:hypothetical protein